MRKQQGLILFALIALAGGILWLLVERAPIEEGRCKLVRRKADPASSLVGLAYQWQEPLSAKPEDVRDLPVGFDRPCYYKIKSGDQRILLVVNLSQPPVLCLDTDGDGVLSEERRWEGTLVCEVKGGVNSWRFGPISPGNVNTADGFYVNCYSQHTPAQLSVRPASFRTGKLRLGGRTYRVAAVDGDCDNRFQSILSLPLDRGLRLLASDVFAIDLTRDGKFDLSLVGCSEVMPLGRLVQIAGGYYAVEVTPDGTNLTFTKAEPPQGTLALEAGDMVAGLKLRSDAADQYLSPGRMWGLPAGKYMAVSATLERREASGEVWTLASDLSSAAVRLGALNCFGIKAGETTTIHVGPPFTVLTNVQRADERTVVIGAVLVGCGGEEYQLSCRRNGKAGPGPVFKIVNEKGNVLVTDKFQYG